MALPPIADPKTKCRWPLVEPSAEIKQWRCETKRLNDGFCGSVSARAFVIWLPMLASGAHEGTRPHFMNLASLRPSFRMITGSPWDVVARLEQKSCGIPHNLCIAVRD